MHTTQADRHPTRDFAAATEAARPSRPAVAPIDDGSDPDWLEFLALGLRLDTVLPAPGRGGWRRTPVLLSY